MSADKQSVESTHYDVVISGMGIGGLVCAYEAVCAGKKNILIITNRANDFVRTQRTVLKVEVDLYADHNRIYLQEMISDTNPIKQLAKELYQINDRETVESIIATINKSMEERPELILSLVIPEGHEVTIKALLSQIPHTADNIQDLKMLYSLEKDVAVSLKDIERYLKRRVDEAAEENKTNIDCLQHHQLQTVNLTDGVASVSSLQEIDQEKIVTFTYLVGADGTRHHALDLVNAGFSPPLITHKKDEVEFHEHNVSAYIVVKRKDGLPLELPEISEQSGDEEIKALKEFYISKDGDLVYIFGIDKSSYAKSHNLSFKTNFVGEVPGGLIELDSDQRLTSTSKENILDSIKEKITNALVEAGMKEVELELLTVKPSRKHGVAKDKVKFLFFPTHLETAEKSAVCVNGHYFLLIGDAYRSSFYPLGHGAYDAISYGRYTQEVFQSNAIESFNEVCAEIADKIQTDVKKFQTKKSEYFEEHKENIRDAEIYLASNKL
ncbi:MULTISPECIES: hypothetical protein [unclassified Legionella]|uniref:hypothetical protein n=1 Tax=unclassified Legionella TaxID=2622702 RepID=UPI001054D9E2|nr:MULTISPECIES: hypothetical protein [unclassified Legionella]MDI9818239.1 hypothetical protein [Legionella sp. PL877]